MIFVWWESRTTKEALVPLHIFKDRNFSVSNVGISAMGLAATAMGFPLMLYAQLVRGYSALEASLLMAPMALMSLFMAPVVGKLTDKVHPRWLVGTGFAMTSISIFWVSAFLTPTSARVADPGADGLARLRHGRHLGTAGGNGDPQPADEPRGCRCRGLQRHPTGRLGHRLGRASRC